MAGNTIKGLKNSTVTFKRTALHMPVVNSINRPYLGLYERKIDALAAAREFALFQPTRPPIGSRRVLLAYID